MIPRIVVLHCNSKILFIKSKWPSSRYAIWTARASKMTTHFNYASLSRIRGRIGQKDHKARGDQQRASKEILSIGSRLAIFQNTTGSFIHFREQAWQRKILSISPYICRSRYEKTIRQNDNEIAIISCYNS